MANRNRSDKLKRRQRRKDKRAASHAARRPAFGHVLEASDDVPADFQFASSCELEAADGAAFELINAAAGDEDKPRKFKMRAYTGGLLDLAAYLYPVVVDLQGITAPTKPIPILRDHSPAAIIGHATAKVGARRIDIVDGQFSGAGADAEEVQAAAVNGFPWEASIGARATQMIRVDDGEKVTVNGRSFTGPILVARKSVLKETSFVALGADRGGATATLTAQHSSQSQGSESMKFNEWLTANGFDEATITAAQRVTLEAAWKAETDQSAAPPPNTPPPAPVQAAAPAASIAVPTVDEITASLRDAGAAELTRQNRINLIAAQEHVDTIPVDASGAFSPSSDNRVPFAQHAIANNWNALNAELVAVRCGRPEASGPATHIRGGNTMETLQASLMQASRFSDEDIVKATSEQALEAAGRQYGGQISLHALLLDAAAINGYQLRSVTAVRTDTRGVLQAAFSTMDLPNIITSNSNRMLLNGFNAVEQGWREISKVGSVSDFKTIGSHRMTGAFEYEEVAPDGKLKHGTIGEEDFSNQAKTYGKMFGITRTQIINDDMGALAALPRRIGRGAALKLNTVFWTEFMDNSAFFTAPRGNYEDGASTALDIDALTAAELLFLNQTDPDGKPLGIMPTRLLVPNALSVTADNLMASLHIATGSTGKNLRNNPHAGKFSTVKSSYLSNAKITGNSALKWYLLSDDEDAAVIETVFLNGQETPVVESADADFSTLGVEMRGYFDFGVAKQEYRGGVAEKGEA